MDNRELITKLGNTDFLKEVVAQLYTSPGQVIEGAGGALKEVVEKLDAFNVRLEAVESIIAELTANPNPDGEQSDAEPEQPQPSAKKKAAKK